MTPEVLGMPCTLGRAPPTAGKMYNSTICISEPVFLVLTLVPLF